MYVVICIDFKSNFIYIYYLFIIQQVDESRVESVQSEIFHVRVSVAKENTNMHTVVFAS